MREEIKINSTETVGYQEQSAHCSTNQKSKENESGRSMVEMLGVLAIMSVLVVGGIAGYRYAMDKYNANEIINEVKKRAVVASQQRIRNLDIDLHEFYPNASVDFIQNRYLVSTANEYNGNSGFFSIDVHSVPEKICNIIIREKWSLPVEIKVGDIVVGADTVCPQNEESTMAFAFSDTLAGGAVPTPGDDEAISCQTDSDCSYFCQSCQDGKCTGGCDGAALEQCYLGECVKAACTYEAGCMPPKTCRVLSNPANNSCRDGECEVDADCQDPSKPYCDVYSGGKCVECREDKDCSKGYCYSDGRCLAPSTCAPGAWYQSEKNCTCEGYAWNGIACCPTEDNTSFPFSALSENACVLCGGRIVNGTCMKVDCTYPTTAETCSACGGVWENEQCLFNVCRTNAECESGQYCGGAKSNFYKNYTGCFDASYEIKKIYYQGNWEQWARFNQKMSYWDALNACELVNGSVPGKDELVVDRWRLLGQQGWQDWVWTTHPFGGGNNDVAGLMNGGTYNDARGASYIVICRIH